MRPEFIKLDEERSFYKIAENLTDRELQELQANYLRQINKNSESLKNNMQFFFYFTIISIAITIITIIAIRN